jgi:hypothetical protein
MKKILSKEEKERKNRINTLLIGSILVFLMIFSTAGYSLMNKDSGSDTSILDYKGVRFTKGTDSYWRFSSLGKSFVTRNSPKELANLSINLGSLSYTNYQNKVLYTAGEPDDNFLIGNMYQIIQRQSRVCLDENCTENAPIKDCNVDNIIIITEAKRNETESMYQYEKCVYITSSYANMPKYIDAFIYKILALD